ncbi:hypothetical protein CEP54_011603 [Fusarium duplospermum]|uniref:Uncharacterized protein n=1 Tax=Fusarium duplospermum TaxID=1325734 RepID=A0A428PDS3_9HYPO|nr:hypothetical protein CEP54_011603 [Fusarium duplospermum]
MADDHLGNQSQQSEDEKPYQLISLKLADRLATLEITDDDLARVSGIAETMLSDAQETKERTRRACDVFRAKMSSIDSLNDFNHNRYEALRTHLQDCFPEGHPTYFKDLAKGYIECGNVICSRLKELKVEGSEIKSKQLEALNQAVEASVCFRACKEMVKRRELHKEDMPAHQEHNEPCLQVEQNHTMSIDELAAEVETYYRVFVQLLNFE